MARNVTARFLLSTRRFFLFYFPTFILLMTSGVLSGQGVISGVVTDSENGETLIGASVVVSGTTTGATTDINGRFSISVKQNSPIELSISYIGYIPTKVVVSGFSTPLQIALEPDRVLMNQIEIVGERISEKQKQAPLTTETMDIIAIKEVPSGNFYQSLGTMKGVDITSASMGFKVINTRGFNSTSPVRSLQIIDGIDNQSPGLNFALGNFLGAPDLDVLKVEVISGASSAYYGPGAFNGVIDMKSKSPFLFPGYSLSLKVGERNMTEVGWRLAEVIKNKAGEDKFAYKLNFYYLTANDWEATNYTPYTTSEAGVANPGGYDAINIYGDEEFGVTNNNKTDLIGMLETPGLGMFYRTGYKESDLVDYDLTNLKLNGSLHYKLSPNTELMYALRYSTGNTVYQGDNRYRLKDIQFMQNHIEINKKDKFFVRAYTTSEDAGKTYDIVQTAYLLNEATGMDDKTWNTNYYNTWNFVLENRVRALEGFPVYSAAEYGTVENYVNNYLSPFLANHQDSLFVWHQSARNTVDQRNTSLIDPRFEPGTARFDSLFNDITSRTFSENGSRFYDRSKLYHLQGQYIEDLDWVKLTVGGDARLYTPQTHGTILRDSLTHTYQRNSNDELVAVDSSYNQIRNWQYGVYAGIDKNFIEDKLKVNATLRMDKNENFEPVFSPAVSLVFSLNPQHTFRATFTSAVRNPTLFDQYQYYDVGRAILLGNVDGQFAPGRDSLFTPESFDDYRNTTSLLEGLTKLDYFHVDPIKPEKVRTMELGYRATLFNHIYLDASYYYSIYHDFIGYIIGISGSFTEFGLPYNLQPYRLAANAEDVVTTQGFSIGMNYYFSKYTLTGNYSYNKLISGSEDPIIPAYNTPENKFNIGFSGRDLYFLGDKNWSFSINYKWVQGFWFEGSPQFTGYIDDYGLVDAQVSYRLKLSGQKAECQFKLGVSNLLDNQIFQVYGGPTIGRLAYISVLLDLNKKQ